MGGRRSIRPEVLANYRLRRRDSGTRSAWWLPELLSRKLSFVNTKTMTIVGSLLAKIGESQAQGLKNAIY